MLPKTPGSNRSGRRIEEGQWEGKRVRYFTDHVIVKFKAPPKGSDRTARSLSDDIARQLPGGRIKRYPRATGRAIVAFDPKENVFDVVKREQVPITIFVSGLWVESHPDVMAELAVDPLVEFGDHSYEHPHMSHLPVARIVQEIDQTEAALAKYGKRSVAFRPPFGEWSHRLVYVVQDLRLPTVTWDVVSGDPSARTTADRMIRNVLDNARPGSIIVFHINGRGWKTGDALPTILQGLRERGLRFVHVSQLMAAARPGAPVIAPIPRAPGPETPPPIAPIPAATLPPPPPASGNP